jgi:transcriptional regulator with XRE-family HTH domain
MRVYLQSRQLGKAIADALLQKGRTQVSAASDLNIAQGQLSHLLSGHFKTKNALVLRACKYVNINPDNFILAARSADELDHDAIAALARACGGQRQKTQAVIRVLRALETLAPGN